MGLAKSRFVRSNREGRMLTPVEFEQLKTKVLRDLRTVLEADPDFAVFIEGIVAEKFPRRDEFARLLDEVALARSEQREGFRQVYERLDRHEAAIVELRAGQEELRAGQVELRQDVIELRAGQVELRQDVIELRAGQEELRAGQEALRAGQVELRQDVIELRAGQEELRAGQEELRAGQVELRQDVIELRAGQAELRQDVIELRAGQEELRAGQEALRMGQAELREELHREIANLTTLINERTEMLRKEFHTAITTLGQRWGILTEDVFRQIMATVIEKTYGDKVRRFKIGSDEIDVVISDGQHILIEMTARTTRGMIRRIERKRAAYIEHTGVVPARIILGTAQIHLAVAHKLEAMGVEIVQPASLFEEEEEPSSAETGA
jgi:hypothetical protein